MVSDKIKILVTAAVISLAAVIVMLGFFDAARGQELSKARDVTAPPQAVKEPDFNFAYGPFYTDTLILDLSKNVIGTGTYEGRVKCNRDHCSQKIQLSYAVPLTDPVVLEYKFKTALVIDSVDRRVVVEGTGTLTSGRQKDRFSFTATFQDNSGGTVASRYDASNPTASFIIPSSPGLFVITQK